MFFIGKWDVRIPTIGLAEVATVLDTETSVTWQYALDHDLRRWAPPSRNGEPQPYGPWLRDDEIAVIAL